MTNFQLNPTVVSVLESLCDTHPELYEHGELLEGLKSCSQLKFRDLIADTVAEYSRMKNFSRVYPALNSKLYDKYFSGNRSLCKVLYKALFTPEIIPFGIVSNQEVKTLPSRNNINRLGTGNQTNTSNGL